MKKITSVIMSIVFVIGLFVSVPVTITANAASQSDLTFKLNSDGKSYTVTDCKDEAKGAITIPSTYKNKPVTKVGAGAFQYCINLTSITISNSITHIGENAFSQIHSVKSITIPDSVKVIGEAAFSHNNNLTSIKISKGLSSVPKYAFRNNYNLKSITIPGNVKTIGMGAFADCGELEVINIQKGVTTISELAFYMNTRVKTLVLPEGLKIIGNQAFYGLNSLKICVVPSTLTSIGEKAIGYESSSTQIKGFKIYSKKGSVAEKYAKNNKFTFAETSKLKLATPTVKAVNTKTGIKVKWDKISNAQSYIIYRSTYNASTKKWSKWSAIKNYESSNQYLDKKVTLGTIYRYTVRAVNGNVLSKYKASDSIRYNVTPTVSYKNVTNGISVSWSTAANAKGYTVYRSEYNTKTKKWSKWANRGTAKANISSWTDKKVTSGVIYKYTVRAVNGSFKSKYNNNTKEILYLKTPTVKISNVETGVKVNWDKIAGAKNYDVYRKVIDNLGVTSTGWVKIATVSAKQNYYLDENAQNGYEYVYTVRTLGGTANTSFKSAYTSSSALVYLSAPQVSVSTEDNGIKVSWDENECAGHGYRVYRAVYNAETEKWSSWAGIADIANAETCEYLDQSVEDGVTYRYTVRALLKKSASSYIASEDINASLKAEEPTVPEETVINVVEQ